MGVKGLVVTGVTGAVGIGAATLGGSFAGATVASNMPGANISQGAAIGGALGFGIGVVGTAASMAVAANPKGAIGLAGSAIEGIGGAGLLAAEKIGDAGLWTAGKVGGMAQVVAPVAAARIMNRGFGVASKLVKPVEDGKFNLLGHKASALGVAAYAGASVVNGVRGAWDDFNRNRMGTHDGQIRRAAPRTPSYSNNAGATGDLVFAMNANRRG